MAKRASKRRVTFDQDPVERLDLIGKRMELPAGFSEVWLMWVTYKLEELGQVYKTDLSEGAAIRQLLLATEGKMYRIRHAVNTAMARQWQGIYWRPELEDQALLEAIDEERAMLTGIHQVPEPNEIQVGRLIEVPTGPSIVSCLDEHDNVVYSPFRLEDGAYTSYVCIVSLMLDLPPANVGEYILKPSHFVSFVKRIKSPLTHDAPFTAARRAFRNGTSFLDELKGVINNEW